MNKRRKFGVSDDFSCEDCRKVLDSMRNNRIDLSSDEHIAKTMVHTLRCPECGNIFLNMRESNTDRF